MNKSIRPRIIATGLVIFKIPLSIKYGMRLWNRLRAAKVPEASSDATKFWKMVEARLKVNVRPNPVRQRS